MNVLLPYKEPFLYSANDDPTKEWYAEYSYLVPGTVDQFERFKERLGINRVKDLQQKKLYGKELVSFLKEQLEAGFNPFTAAQKPDNTDFKVHAQLLKVRNALNVNASDTMIASYTEMYNRFIKWVEAKKYSGLYMSGFSLQHLISFKKWALHEKDLSVKTVNNTLSHLSMFWDQGIEMGFTMQNPFKELPKAKKRNKSVQSKRKKQERFEPLTDDEMIVIFPYLYENGHQNFMNFLALIYYAWARPQEITRLRVCDIELERQLIRFKKHETKNDDAAYVQIVPPLMDLFLKMNLSQYPPDYYLFSDNYLPGKRQLNKSLASKHWRIMVKGVLNIKKDMYALKHTGNIEYLLKNKGKTDLKWQQMQNRHKTSSVTDRYNKGLGVYFIEMKEMNFRLIA